MPLYRSTKENSIGEKSDESLFWETQMIIFFGTILAKKPVKTLANKNTHKWGQCKTLQVITVRILGEHFRTGTMFFF